MASRVLETPPAAPGESYRHFAATLAFETDSADVYADQKAASTGEDVGFVLADVRSAEAYNQEHAAGAVSLPHTEISKDRLAAYPADTVFVVYCWSQGCNGAAKAAVKLSRLGRSVKLMLGGIEAWKREGLPTGGAESDLTQA